MPAGNSQDLDHALLVLNAQIDEEFRISERLDSKSRQAFGLAVVFFAAVQTVALGSFGRDAIHGGERFLVIAAALLAGAAVLIVAHRLANGEDTLEELDTKPSAIVGWFGEPDAHPGSVSAHLVAERAPIAERRASNNDIRKGNYDSVAAAARWALILTGVELVAAVVVRI